MPRAWQTTPGAATPGSGPAHARVVRRARPAGTFGACRRSHTGTAVYAAAQLTVPPAPDPVPWKPNTVLAPAPSCPFQGALATVICEPAFA